MIRAKAAPAGLRRAVTAAALASVLACGCAGSSADSAAAGAGGSCAGAACVAALTTHHSWSIEIDPLSTSDAALTELAAVDVGPAPLALGAEAQATVTVGFAPSTSALLPASANAVLSFPPLIGGLPDRTYQATATLTGGGASATAAIAVPSGALGRAGVLDLVPISPADQSVPPYAFPVTIAATLAVTLPSDNLRMAGTLHSAVGAPPTAPFVARAFAGGVPVSDAPVAAANDGSFTLELPSAVAASAPNGVVTVELTPQNVDGSDPWWVSDPLPPGKNLDVITLSAYINPNAFGVYVQGGDAAMGPVAGAFVRAQTTLPPGAGAGTTNFARSGTTGQTGSVSLSLLPGSANATLSYDLTVIPPAASPYATTCLPHNTVTVGGTTTNPVTLAAVALPARPVLAGRVSGAAGDPAANVAITATAGPGPTDGCTTTPGVSSSAVTDADGGYRLPLDPGTYQLDFDPPAGSPFPRVTQTVLVAGAATTIAHDVPLPRAALVTGTVTGPDDGPLAGATVRLYDVQCTGTDSCFGATRTPPSLLAVAATDGNGRFAAVVAPP